MANTKAILLLLCLFPMPAIAQQLNNAFYSTHLFPTTYPVKDDSLILPLKAYYNAGDSTSHYFLFITGVCKGNYFSKTSFQLQELVAQPKDAPLKQSASSNPVFLNTHGDVNYDFFYRSAIDTPYADNNIAQHSVHANLYTTIKNIPVAIHISARQSNSYLFKNYIDANIEFDRQHYQSYLKEKLKAKMIDKIRQEAPDSLLHKLLQNRYAAQQQLAQWLQDGRQVQQMTDSRQAIASITGDADISTYNKDMMNDKIKAYLKDTLDEKIAEHTQGTDYKKWLNKGAKFSQGANQLAALKNQNPFGIAKTVLSSKQEKAVAYVKEYLSKKEKYQQIKGEVDEWEEKYNKAKRTTQQTIDSARQVIDNMDDPEALQSQAKKYGLDSSKTYRRVKHLLAIQRLSIGRSMVDYSELSAKNISVTGVNMEYNARFYYAVTAGTVDYRYRDFILNRNSRVAQHLILVRAGIGKKEGTRLILTAYQGQKQSAGFTNNNTPLTNKLFGVTLEGRYYVNKHNYIIAEVAKSTYPKNIQVQNGGGTTSKPSALSDRSNEAYSAQLFSDIPATATRIYGLYKRLGANFQSLNTFNYNAGYAAWQIQVNQPFFKRALLVSASLKSNQYNSPYTIYNYKSSTIFKSIQATLRFKKWPVLSMGYMPSSQLSKAGNEIVETRFNMIMATANYMYRVSRVYMHTSVMYTRFFNEGNQRDFIYYNSSNWLVNHSIMGSRLTFNSAFSLSYSPGYRLVTLDEGISYDINNWLKAGGGIKLNRLNRNGVKPGYYGNAQLKLKRLGEVILSFDRGFLPGMDQTLIPNDVVRVIYLKSF